MTRFAFALVLASLSAACAHSPGGTPVPESLLQFDEQTLALDQRVDAVGLTHIMRAQYMEVRGRQQLAQEHLRLAQMYHPDSSYIHYKRAFGALAYGLEDAGSEQLQKGLQKHPDDPWMNDLAGQMEMRHNRFAEATAYFERAFKSVDTRMTTAPGLTDALLWQGRYKETVDVVGRIVEVQPVDPELLNAVALIFEDHGRLTEALKLYRLVRRLSPPDRMAAGGEMRVLFLQGEPQKAAQALVPLFSYYPAELRIYIHITRMLRLAGSADAELYYQEALRHTEGDAEGRAAVAFEDLRSGNEEAGMGLLKALVERYREDEVRAVYVEALAERGVYGECLKNAAKVTASTGEREQAFGDCHGGAGEFDKMLASYERAVAEGYSPRVVPAKMIQWLGRADSYERAQGVWRKAYDLFGGTINDADKQRTEATLADHYGDFAAAVSAFEALLKEEPKDADNRLRLADLLVRAGKKERGLAMMRELLREAPSDVMRLNALGFTLADLNRDLHEAEIYLRRAYRMAYDESFIIDSLGWLLYRQGRFNEALLLLRRATLGDPRDPEILRHLGDVYRALGKHAEARKIYSQALTVHPSATLRRLLRERLGQRGDG